jgi:hypothetical protein
VYSVDQGLGRHRCGSAGHFQAETRVAYDFTTEETNQ